MKLKAIGLALAAGLFLSAQEPGQPGFRMSTLALSDLAGKPADIGTAGQITVVTFVSVQCPVSNAYNQRMAEVYSAYTPRGVRFVFVNANATESAAAVSKHAQDNQFPFPVYKDANNVLADRLNAQVTPESFVFDSSGVIRYHGPIDDAQAPQRVSARHLATALDAMLASRPVASAELKAFGCTIKRKK